MAVKISKLWGNNKFINLTNDVKLLYIYIITHPSINSVGVLLLNLDITIVNLNTTLEHLRGNCKTLIDEGYIRIKKSGNILYVIAPAHFNTLAKSDSTIIKINNDLRDLPDDVVKELDSLGINSNSKIKKFIKPKEEEVLEYSMKQGHKVDAKMFINFYEDESRRRGKTDCWVNSKGKLVRDWKATIRNVWFKDENKFTICKDAPKGFEYFYVEVEGKTYFPDSWRDGLPQSKNFLVKKELRKQYEQRTKNSS